MELKWLILEDSKMDRDDLRKELEDNLQKVFEASNIVEARKILREENINICVFDYFLGGKNETSAKLISELRKGKPSIPIVLCTSAEFGNESFSKLFQAGVDIVLPKALDDLKFGRTLLSAGLGEYQKIQMRNKAEWQVKNDITKIFMQPALEKELAIISKDVIDVVLVMGNKGTGKTGFARRLAETVLDKSSKQLKAPWREFDCKDKSNEEIATSLFEEIPNFATFSLFEEGRGSVVLIDNIQFLTPDLFKKLYKIICEKTYVSRDGATIDLTSTKFILTCDRSFYTKLPLGFHEKLGIHVVSLPSLFELGKDIEKSIDFIVKKEARKRMLDAPIVTDEYKRSLAEFIVSPAIIDNYLTLERIIAESVMSISQSNRRTLYETDLALPKPRELENEKSVPFVQKTIDEFISLIKNPHDLKHGLFLATRAIFASAIHKYGAKPQEICLALEISKTKLYDQGYIDLLTKINETIPTD